MPTSTTLSRDLLDAAIARGVLTAEQRAQLEALAVEMASVPKPPESPEQPTKAVESPRAFNAVTVAYFAGGGLVVVALGWFLAEHWDQLGAAGVLAVSLGYVALFAGTSAVLARRGFRVASGITLTVAATLTPVWAWAILDLAGEWPSPARNIGLWEFVPFAASRWIVLELATIGVALATVRRWPVFTLGLPIAVAFAGVMTHLGQAFGDPELVRFTGPWYLLFVAVVEFGVAYVVDRRRPAHEDHALWFYLASMITGAASVMGLWNIIDAGRHALPFVALLLFVAAVYLRRRVVLAGGALALLGYVAWLAFDVFKKWLGFPLVLAGFGLTVILATVWLQRRFPRLVASVHGDDGDARGYLPHARLILPGAALIAAALLASAASGARERHAAELARSALMRRQSARVAREHRERLERERARPDTQPVVPSPAPARSETGSRRRS